MNEYLSERRSAQGYKGHSDSLQGQLQAVINVLLCSEGCVIDSLWSISKRYPSFLLLFNDILPVVIIYSVKSHD